MNQNFTRARDLLFQQTNGPANWQFLSISFDPEFDRPGVDGNKWKPRDLADAMIEAARSEGLLTQQKAAKTD